MFRPWESLFWIRGASWKSNGKGQVVKRNFCPLEYSALVSQPQYPVKTIAYICSKFGTALASLEMMLAEFPCRFNVIRTLGE